jgi:dihydrofolate reductase
MNKIILYIATSQDGFIADKNGGVDWLPQPKDDQDLEIFGYKKLMQRIDTILMGSQSFQQIIGFGDWAWVDKQTYVFSSKPLKSPHSYITITNSNPIQFMQNLKDRKSDKDIWLLGGAKLAKSFDQESLIDEIILTIVPQTLGEGIPLDLSFTPFYLSEQKVFMDGIIQKIYLRKMI